MIPYEILRQLVPNRYPEGEFTIARGSRDGEREGPERWISAWTSHLRLAIRDQALSDPVLMQALQTSGFIATGIFRSRRFRRPGGDFPDVGGFRFGAVLLRASRYIADGDDSSDWVYPGYITLERGSLKAPIRQALAVFEDHHDPAQPDGFVAATFTRDGNSFGITARHVVAKQRRGQLVGIRCSACHEPARLSVCAPGAIDAAVVEFSCSGPTIAHLPPSNLRNALEGEMVVMNLGSSRAKPATVMMSLSSPAEILTAAASKSFLIDDTGHNGDSGSLISGPGHRDTAELIGIYLGSTKCELTNGLQAVYGFAQDIGQAAAILGASAIRGVFNA